jgi:hypothetical protein
MSLTRSDSGAAALPDRPRLERDVKLTTE